LFAPFVITCNNCYKQTLTEARQQQHQWNPLKPLINSFLYENNDEWILLIVIWAHLRTVGFSVQLSVAEVGTGKAEKR